MAKIALDSKSHQAIREEGTEGSYYLRAPRAGRWQGERLKGLKSILESNGNSLHIVDLETDRWADASVLIIAGRNNIVSFAEPELDRIADFSQHGGGILLMANHPPGFVSPQNQVSKRLKLPVIFQMDEGNSGGYRLLPHEISQGCKDIQIRRFCRMSISQSPLTTIIAEHSGQNIGEFAVAIKSGDGHARVVAMGSAGHISSLDDDDLDMFSSASNAQWTLGAIDWLKNG